MEVINLQIVNPGPLISSVVIHTGLPGPAGPQGSPGANGANGSNGANGANGAAGANGLSAYAVAVANGFVGNEAAWLASLVGAQGIAGATGATGAAGANGTNGTNGAQGPQGPAGPAGSSLGAPYLEAMEHFINRADGGTSYFNPIWAAFSSNGGFASLNTTAALQLHPGIVRMNNSASASSWVHMSSGSAQTRFGGQTHVFEAGVRIPQLSTGSETFTFIVGFYDSVSGVSVVDGAFFRYSHGNNSGKWEAITRNNSTQTVVDTGVTVVANYWYRLRVEVNAAGTLATFTLMTETGTVLATVTSSTNIPTAAGRETGSGAVLNKSVGTGTIYVEVDYFYLKISP